MMLKQGRQWAKPLDQVLTMRMLDCSKGMIDTGQKRNWVELLLIVEEMNQYHEIGIAKFYESWSTVQVDSI